MPDAQGQDAAARYVTPALIALGVIVAAFLVFQLAAPSRPAPEPPAEPQGAAEVGPRERYGLSPRDVASLPAGELAQRALAKSNIGLVREAAAEDELSATILCAAEFTGEGATQDDAAAARSCAGAQAQGSAFGAYVISVLTREGRGGLAADERAADALLRDAAKTDARAQYALAQRVRSSRATEARALIDSCAAKAANATPPPRSRPIRCSRKRDSILPRRAKWRACISTATASSATATAPFCCCGARKCWRMAKRAICSACRRKRATACRGKKR
jgi:hypothetical protein